MKEESGYRLSASGAYHRDDEDKSDGYDVSKDDMHDHLLQVQRWYPEIWERYQPVQVLGISDRKVVVKAQDGRNKQFVVIKIFDISAAVNEDEINRFEREFSVLKCLQIEGVPKSIDYVKMRRYHYCVEEYINARSLQDRIDDHSFIAEQDVLKIFRSCLKCLAAFQAQTPPIILRDIKPSHILEMDGKVWFINVGLDAWASPKTSTCTNANQCDYSAPEQLRGELYASSNLYSVSMMMIHLLTKVAPDQIPDDGFRVLYKQYLVSLYAPCLSEVFDRVLVLKPKRRLKSAEEALKIFV